jgi:hypothetical protein
MQYDRSAVVRRLNGGDERGLVMCTTAAPAGHLTAEVGIVDLDPVAEGILLTSLEHHLHQFVLHPPGSIVLDPDGTCVLKAGPGDLAAAAGTDESEATLFLDELTAQGQCEYSDKVIRFLRPSHDGRKSKGLARSR